MAADLKTTLRKVLDGKGGKRFPFAYGTGKRQDGKGDGALIVDSHGTKPKKDDLENELDGDCKQFIVGFCWGSKDGETVLFGAKPKPGGAMLAKMMLTAKKVTGQQFEFAVPSPEEEAQADKELEDYEGLRSTVVPDLAQLRKSDPGKAGEIQKMVDEAANCAKDGDYAKGVSLLGQATTALAGAASGKRTTEAKQTVPVGKVGLETLRQELHAVRVDAVTGISKLIGELDKDPHPQAKGIAQVVKTLAQEMPRELEGVLDQLNQSLKDNDLTAVAKHKAEVKVSVRHWMQFLETEKDPIAGCEANPWKIPIRIVKPAQASLALILKAAQ